MKNRNVFLLVIIVGVVIAVLFLLTSRNNKMKPAGSEYDASEDFSCTEIKKMVEEGEIDTAIERLNKAIVENPRAKNIIEGHILLAELYVKNDQLLKAKKVYHDLIAKFPNHQDVSAIQNKLWDLNIKVLFSPIKTDDATIYEVQAGDALFKIAKKFNTTVGMLTRANNLSSSHIYPSQQLKVTTAKFSMIIDKSLNTLTLKANDEILKIYRVATGKNNSTPVGDFKILTKLIDPPWYKTGAILPIPPESPENILGSRWMGIDVQGYGIHGTTIPESIGKSTTAGCVRMLNTDVEELYDIVPVGTGVVIQE
ncbi:MAG: L,D-transpeptidase family protein [Candidatus Omnitrophota bacterium]